MPPVPYPSATLNESGREAGHLPFMKDNLDEAMTAARRANRPLFVDFTGFQCANCRQMETGMFPNPAVRRRLAQMVRLKAFTDGPLDVHRTQREYQLQRFGTAVLPFYVILDPRTDTVLATFSSMTTNESDFVSFLDQGLAAFDENRQ